MNGMHLHSSRRGIVFRIERGCLGKWWPRIHPVDAGGAKSSQ